MKNFLILTLLTASLLYAGPIRIITPYIGSISNQLSVEHMDDLKDTALLGGLYFQCVRPDRHQWNVFVYNSRDINESNILGTHFIFDYYLTRLPVKGKFVLGAGFDYIQIVTDGNVSPALSEFKMTNKVYAPYLRAGRYFDFGSRAGGISILPWAGYEQDIVRGDLSFKVPAGPGMTVHVEDDIKNDDGYAMLGINTKLTFFHFIELCVKYHRKFSLNEKEDLNTLSGMLNLYLNRHWGFSYRYKYMEVSVSKNTYHMGGIAYIF